MSGWVGGWTDGFVWLHVACGDIGCGRLVCSSRAALVERWRLWVFFMVDELGWFVKVQKKDYAGAVVSLKAAVDSGFVPEADVPLISILRDWL